MNLIDQIDFHVHTNRSACAQKDLTVERVLKRYSDLGFRYITLVDHCHPDTNPTQFLEQKEEVRETKERLGLELEVYTSLDFTVR